MYNEFPVSDDNLHDDFIWLNPVVLRDPAKEPVNILKSHVHELLTKLIFYQTCLTMKDSVQVKEYRLILEQIINTNEEVILATWTAFRLLYNNSTRFVKRMRDIWIKEHFPANYRNFLV